MREVIMRLTPKEFEQVEHAEIVGELVRCKDCRYWDRETIRQNSNDAGWWNEAVCLNFEKREKGWDDFDRYTDAEWFCADGERRDDER